MVKQTLESWAVTKTTNMLVRWTVAMWRSGKSRPTATRSLGWTRLVRSWPVAWIILEGDEKWKGLFFWEGEVRRGFSVIVVDKHIYLIMILQEIKTIGNKVQLSNSCGCWRQLSKMPSSDPCISKTFQALIERCLTVV